MAPTKKKNTSLTSLVYEENLEEIWSNLVPGIENAVGIWRRVGWGGGRVEIDFEPRRCLALVY